MPAIVELPGLDEAMARLDAAEQAENITPVESTPEAAPEIPTQPGEAQSDGTQPDPLKTDTPAAAEPKPAEPKTEPSKPVEQGSKFAKDRQRRDDSWKALNTEKDNHKKALEEFKSQQQTFERQKQTFEQQRAKSSAKFTPEQYETTAQQKLQAADGLMLQADGLDKRAEQLEDAGKFAESQAAKAQAQDKREEAAAERGLSKQLKCVAADMRANPDPTLAQVQQQAQAALKHYTLEAAKQWPDMAKDGSEFQKAVANHLQEAHKQGIDPNEHPILMYHAARLTAAETASARVPGLEKELGELRAKVKELESLTNPGGGTTAAARPPGQSAKSDADEEAELRNMALTM